MPDQTAARTEVRARPKKIEADASMYLLLVKHDRYLIGDKI